MHATIYQNGTEQFKLYRGRNFVKSRLLLDDDMSCGERGIIEMTKIGFEFRTSALIPC